MQSASRSWSRSTTWGLGAFITVSIIGAASAGPWAGLAFAAIFTMVTGIYHLVRGSSWMSPFVPRGRKSGAALLFSSFVVLIVAAALSPEPDPQSAIPTTPAPSVVTPSSAPSTITTRPSSVPTRSVASLASPPAPTSVAPSTSEVTDPRLALSVLKSLEIKGRAPKTGYDRALFGQRWADVDRNGCDTRNDVLGRDLTGTTTKPNTRDCVILTGTLVDPYTGTTIDFVRGQDTSTEVHIDHVVALSDAWQKGAQQLDDAARTLVANDPLNLLAVQGKANMQKGDGDAATWLPSNKSFRCDYVARQVAVKARYELWVTQAEHDAIDRVLSQCPGQELPDEGPVPVTPATTSSVATPNETVVTPPPPPPAEAPPATQASEDVYYENCTAAREAGAAPLLRGEPGYRSRMDGDNDGIACE